MTRTNRAEWLTLWLTCLALTGFTAGCGGTAELVDPEPGPASEWEPPPGGELLEDGGGELDAGAVDTEPTDAGAPGEDAGDQQADAGPMLTDGGDDLADAGDEPVDAGVAPGDAGEEHRDAGAGARTDAGGAPGDAGHLDAGVRDAGAPPPPPPPVLAKTLNTSVVSMIVEPDGSGVDDRGASYTDQNYWNFCVPGAVTAALYYFKPTNVTGWPAGYFKEPSHAPSTIPSSGTYWKSASTSGGYASKGRAYLMYLAMQVKPPSYSAPGVANFATYPSTGAGLVDGRDALNWEASGHASNWSGYFYVAVTAANATSAKLHTHIKADIDSGHAVLVFGDTAYLPNWSRSLFHAIAVVGYDDSAKTYKYIDTCGKRCNGSSKAKNGGVWTISQSALYSAVHNGAGYLW